MDYGLVLFTSDRGIAPASAAKLADDHGFTTFYVPEHTHIPIKREAAHPTTGDESLPDDRYMRTLDPWVSLGTACAVTSRVRLSTAVALPVEHDPITLAKSIATLDHLSGGRVSLGVGFGWNTDELADHKVPPGRRRTMLREYLEAMRALWTQEEAYYDGEFVNFGPSLGLAQAGAGTHPGAGRRGGHREELQVDREVRRRLDHHAARLRHRRAGEAAAGHLGRRRPRRGAADRGAGLQARRRKAGPLARISASPRCCSACRTSPRPRSPPTWSGWRASSPSWSESHSWFSSGTHGHTTSAVHDEDMTEEHDRGFGYDVSVMSRRRILLGFGAVAGLSAVAACGTNTSAAAPAAPAGCRRKPWAPTPATVPTAPTC